MMVCLTSLELRLKYAEDFVRLKHCLCYMHMNPGDRYIAIAKKAAAALMLDVKNNATFHSASAQTETEDKSK